MKPVGLVEPNSGLRPHAVVQLRQDNLAAEHYSMVGFQTQLRWPEQKRIFSMIPGLRDAEFVRLGQVHRNCYINAPRVLRPTLQTRERPTLLFRRSDLGRRGLHGIGGDGSARGNERRAAGDGRDPLDRPRGHDARGADALHRVGRFFELPTDERGVRPSPRALDAFPPEGGPAQGPLGPRARVSRRVDRRRARIRPPRARRREGSRIATIAPSPGSSPTSKISGRSPSRLCARTRATSRSFARCSSTATASRPRGPKRSMR